MSIANALTSTVGLDSMVARKVAQSATSDEVAEATAILAEMDRIESARIVKSRRLREIAAAVHFRYSEELKAARAKTKANG
jgi:hypothetical protein